MSEDSAFPLDAEQDQAREIVDSNRFRLVELIAEGGMGTVYRAYQYGTAGFVKRVAIKTLNLHASNDAEFVEMFIGEAKLVADLVHQNIVQIYQLGKAGGRLYIAMELIEGCNLQEFLDALDDAGKLLEPKFAAFIVSRICRGLHYAHNKRSAEGSLLGVVHRDISPKNILMTWGGVVKITDWGIAKARDLMLDNEGDVLLGKSQYMSPEQASFKTTDHRSDIFSLGIVFYELLAGQQLFGGDGDTVAVLDRVLYRQLPKVTEARPDTPPELVAILEKALSRDRDARYQTAREMADALEHYMYDDGYGPTNESFAVYLNALFPLRARTGKHKPVRRPSPPGE